MAKEQKKSSGKGKGAARKLGVKKQPIRDLEAPEGGAQRVKGGAPAGFVWKKR